MTKRVFSGYGSHSIVVDFILSRKTGTLVFYPGARKLFFDKGNLVFAGSEVPDEHFSEILVQNGILSTESLSAIRSGLKKGESLGRALKNRGFATPRQLARALKQQISRIMAGVFDLDGGQCQVLENILPDRLPKLRIQTLTLVIQSITHSSTPEQIATFSPKGEFRTTPNFAVVRAGFEFPAIYHAFIDFVDHSEKISAAILGKEFAYHPVLIKRLLYFLYITDMIQPIPTPKDADENALAATPQIAAAGGGEREAEDTLPTPEKAPAMNTGTRQNRQTPEPDFALDGDATLGERALSVEIETGPSMDLNENGVSIPVEAEKGAADQILEGPVRELESALQKIETEDAWASSDPERQESKASPRETTLSRDDVIMYEPDEEEHAPPTPAKTNKWRNTLLIAIAFLALALVAVLFFLPASLFESLWPPGKENRAAQDLGAVTMEDPLPTDTAPLTEMPAPSATETEEDPADSEPETMPQPTLEENAERVTMASEAHSESNEEARPPEVEDKILAWTSGNYPGLVEQSRERMRLQEAGYSIALIVACEKETLDDIFREFSDENLFLFPRKIDSRNCYLLTWGGYPNREQALKARKDLPAYFKQRDGGAGWIVKLEGRL